MPTEPNRLIMLYDGHCPMCARTAAKLRSLKLRTSLEALPYQQADLSALAPGVAPEDVDRELHVVAGDGIFRGADAVLRIVQEIPALSGLKYVAKLPFGSKIAHAAYRYVAARRYDWFGKNEDCDDGACSVHRNKD